ncbi:MAG: hypothetical protein AAF358_13485 [Pseudomonadota bacterium]
MNDLEGEIREQKQEIAALKRRIFALETKVGTGDRPPIVDTNRRITDSTVRGNREALGR